MKIFHLLLCFLLVSCGAVVSSSVNSIESILFLILTFFNAAVILFLFGVDFLGLTFIIVYVGAIAVLFLFVIMMLSIKINEQNLLSSRFSKSKLVSFLLVLHLFALFFLFSTKLFALSTFENFSIFFRSWENLILFDLLFNIDVLGQAFYNQFFTCFLVAGLILLIALIGAVVLTLRFNNTQKGQSVFRQLSRTDNLLSFFS